MLVERRALAQERRIVPETGRKMHFTGPTVLRLKVGKILEEVGLDDGVTALQQLGVIRPVARNKE